MSDGRGDLPARRAQTEAELAEELSLVELVDRVLDRGVRLRGEVMVSVAGVDLLYLGLDLLLSSVETIERRRVADVTESARRASEQA